VTDIHNGANFFVADQKAAFAAAEAGLTKVLSSAPDNALAHMWLGFVDMFTKRATQAIAECEHALELDRNLAAAHSCLGLAKTIVGRQEETEAHIKEALRLSPRDTYASAWMNFASVAELELGSYEDAVDWSRRALEANRNYPNAIFALASALAQLGRLDEAHSAVFAVSRVRAAMAPSDNPMIQTRRERYLEGLRKAGVPEE
jgi:tetratricopeptide (TPR) repeat protein